MDLPKRRRGPVKRLSANIMIALSPELYARVMREAEETEGTLASVVRARLARSYAREATPRGDGETAARAA